MPLRYEKADGIATITIDNPPVNVFTPELHRDLFHILRDFIADRAIRAGILTGAGDRAFCAGDDIKTARPKRSTAEVVERHFYPKHEGQSLEYPGWESEVKRIAEERFKPIVAAVNGHVMGMGMIYLLQLTDIRVASSQRDLRPAGDRLWHGRRERLDAARTADPAGRCSVAGPHRRAFRR